jgi:hypothetical protein
MVLATICRVRRAARAPGALSYREEPCRPSRSIPTSTARSVRSSSQSMRSSAKVRGAAGAVTHHVKAVSAYQGIVTLSRAHRVGSSPRPCC